MISVRDFILRGWDVDFEALVEDDRVLEEIGARTRIVRAPRGVTMRVEISYSMSISRMPAKEQ